MNDTLHEIAETRHRSDAGGNSEYTVICSCGWVEKAHDDNILRARWLRHADLTNQKEPR